MSRGQHEELLERIKDGFDNILAALKQKDIKIVVELDTSVQKEILAVVKDIQKKLDEDLANRATLEEVNEILGPVLTRIQQVP